MKFRRRIKIFPGITINLSKTGVSMTYGVKGLSVNVGKKGTYLNTGIPGTGFYDRKRIDKGSKDLQNHPPLKDNEFTEANLSREEMINAELHRLYSSNKPLFLEYANKWYVEDLEYYKSYVLPILFPNSSKRFLTFPKVEKKKINPNVVLLIFIILCFVIAVFIYL